MQETRPKHAGGRPRKQPLTPELTDDALVDIAEQIKLGVRVDSRVAVDAVHALDDHAAENEPAVGGRGNFHRKPSMTHLYRPIENMGHGDRRQVPIGNLTTLIRSGWTLRCPYCNQRDCSQELNVCSGMEKKQFVRCPTCGKRIQDEIEGENVGYSEEQDEYEVTITPNLTVTQRLTNRLSEHMRTFHPSAARQYGFGTLAQPTSPAPPLTPAEEIPLEAINLRSDPPFEGGDLA